MLYAINKIVKLVLAKRIGTKISSPFLKAMGVPYSHLKRYKTSISGNLSIMIALILPVMFLLIGGVLHFQTLTRSYATLSQITDQAALAALNYTSGTKEEAEATFKDSFERATALVPMLNGATYELDYNKNNNIITLSANAHAVIPIPAFPYLNMSNKVAVHSETTKGLSNLEVVFVFDISSSMRSRKRMVEAKAAAKELVNNIFDNLENVTVSIVPFGGNVALPAAFDNLLSNPNDTNLWVDGKWNGCLQYNDSAFTNAITPAMVFPGFADFYVEKWPWQTDIYCPLEGNELIPPVDNRSALLKKIDDLSFSQGTSSNIGLLWGYNMIAPAWRGHLPSAKTGYPLDFLSTNKKVVILLTDGEIAKGFYPKTSQINGQTPPFATNRLVKKKPAMIDQYNAMCDRMRADKIEVFTVGFMVSNQTLADCATSPSHYYESDSGNLSSDLEKIYRTLDPLRLSQ